jgi:predicted  nucleic acid-binding Zn-ribbon protein
MHPDLVKLLELQSKDHALLETERVLEAIQAEAAALDQQLKGAEQSLATSQKAVADVTRRRTEVEGKMENYRKLEERGKARLDQVKTPKEMQAVNVELDLARSVLAKEEGDWVKLAEILSNHENNVAEATARLDEMKAGQVTARAEIAGRQKEAEASRQEALEARNASAGEVNRQLRSRYERLRTVRTTVVVALDGPACGSCHTQVPLNRRSQMRAGTLIDFCESCGVILYAADDVG